VKPWLRSPGRMAIPPGSSLRALRVGSGRGPTVRTAPRGARSGRMKHATGFTCWSRRDHQDRREPEPLVASALSPDMPLKPTSRPPLRPKVSVRFDEVRGNKIGTRDNRASASVPLIYELCKWKRCGNLTHLNGAPYRFHQHNVEMSIHIRTTIQPTAGWAEAPRGDTLMPMALKKPASTCS